MSNDPKVASPVIGEYAARASAAVDARPKTERSFTKPDVTATSGFFVPKRQLGSVAETV